MASKNLSQVSFSTKFSKILLGIEALGSPKGAWGWHMCMRLCWTRRSPIASAQVIKRKEEKLMVEAVSSRELTKSKMTGMLDLGQSFRSDNVPKASLQRGVCYFRGIPSVCLTLLRFMLDFF